MKFKHLPEDFKVEELPAISPGREGDFSFYRLSKWDIGTLEALKIIGRQWNIPSRRIRYGGLKDRHARTIQYLTIEKGPMEKLETPSFILEPLGKVDAAYTAHHFTGNRFAITLRNLTTAEVEGMKQVIAVIGKAGIPNYFDEQRFGSVGKSGEFIVKSWLKSDFERALWLAMADPNLSDRAETKKIKAALRKKWKDWSTLKAELPRSSERSIISYLCDHPEDFKGAFARLRRDLRALYFSAFQSYIWNQVLSRMIEHKAEQVQRIPTRRGDLSLPVRLGNEAREWLEEPLPLPCARNRMPEGERGTIIRQVLEEQGLEWKRFRVYFLKDVFFARGARPTFLPMGEIASTERADECFPGFRALELAFTLGRGAYATMLVKCLSLGSAVVEEAQKDF